MQPLSKLVQDSIQHLIPKLPYKARDTKHIHQIITQLNRQWQHLGGLPESAKQVAADVRKLFPSVDNAMGIPVVKRLLQSNPHPEGLPTELIIEALTICLEDNFCEFCGSYYKGNSGSQMGPAHSCDYCDIFVGELDEDLVENLETNNIEHTQWTVFRDDGWDVLLNADQDLPKFEEILEGLHPNIKWDVRTSSAEDNHALEHLDLTIYIINGKLETDIFAKDIPIYLSRKSCHPIHVFKSVVKSTAIRLNQNCSLDNFLWERKSEYSRYFYASLYKPKEVDQIMDENTGLTKNERGDFVRGPARENRENFIFRPRRNKRAGGKKHVMCTLWDPRLPDIAAILKRNKSTLYRDPINRRLYPEGSIIAGFRKRRNIGTMVAPTTPRRQPRPPRGDGGCGPCQSRTCQLHQNNLVTTDTVISPWDNRPHKIKKNLTCDSPFPVYYLQCSPCPAGVNITPHYCGSSANTMKVRWRAHKADMTKGIGKDCGFCKHWKQYHGANYKDLSSVKVYLLDSCANPGRKEDDWPGLRRLEERWYTDLGSLGLLDSVQGCNKKDDARAGAWKDN